MSTANSTAKAKVNKPYPEFPLFPHASGRWAKKIKGKHHYFGSLAGGSDAALANYLSRKDALHAGLTPVDTRAGLTVQELCRKFLAFKVARRNAGELSGHLYNEYGAVVKRLLSKLGKDRLVSTLGAEDFAKLRKAMVKKEWGVHRVTNEIVRIKTIFKYADEEGLIDRRPVYGQSFKPPSKKDLRRHRATVGSKVFAASDVCRMIDAAGLPMKAMILLGLNGAMSNSDLANLPISVLDLESGWLNFARVKTGIERRIPLWPETVTAIREWLAARPTPKDDVGLVFVTKYGNDWKRRENDSPISKECKKLIDDLDIKGAKSFYSLRHTFQNVGEQSKDFLAVRAIMGHVISDVSDFYREEVGDVRLKAVTDHVRDWLLAGRQAKGVAS